LLRSTVILGLSLEESKVQNDLSFVFCGNGEGRKRPERNATFQVPAMRQAVLGATTEAVRYGFPPSQRDSVPNPPLPR